MLNVTIYPDAASLLDTENDGVTFHELNYVSLVNNQTYGPPALIAPSPARNGGAVPGERVLYINTNLVPVFEIVRTSD
jgi:hypothetical protein